jgi:hypothetical protein
MRKLSGILIWMMWAAIAAAQQKPVSAPADSTRVITEKAVAKKKAEPISPYLTDTLIQAIPLGRALFHDKTDKEQLRADAADGNTDGQITMPGNTLHTNTITHALIAGIDRLQLMAENMPANGRDSVAANQQKIQSLRALWELMRHYSTDPKPNAQYYSLLVANMHDMIVAANEKKSLDYVMCNPDLYTLDNSRVLLDNDLEARVYIYTYMGKQDPLMLVKRLEEYARDTFAGSIVAAAARIAPKIVFNYCLSSNVLLKSAVYRTKDPYVQAIVQITAESEAPLRALPFVVDVYKGTLTINEIDSIAALPNACYNRLVELRTTSDAYTRQLITEELEYRTLKNYVRLLNELHDTTDVVRFGCVDSLPAASLYYVMVYGREEIYTSSYLGTFRRMMERMAPKRGNELLQQLGYDNFRTFIRLCAGYNTLSEFLTTMDDTARSGLMTRFVGGLQYGGENELEDAVNVADAIGSIKDSALYVYLQQEIKNNYKQCLKTENKKGVAIYSLLSMLMDGNRAAGNDDGAATVSARLKLPPINKVPFGRLTNDTGTVYERLFFYGDDDGKTAYEGFVEEYKKNKKIWRIDTGKYWTTVTSLTGKRVVVYANTPLKAPEDEKAIDTLDAYLYAQNIQPTVLIHRGHSYHVKTTLARVDTHARVVVLGSCGGYHNVATVLQSSPDAHIISSKQTGVGAINEPIITAINAQLLEGSDINWITTWQGLDEYFAKRKDLYERFADYVPPHKNMGVIFMKAYRMLRNEPNRK